MQFQLKGMLAEWYSNNLSRETKKGHTEKARQGGWVGPVPLGYTRDGATLTPSEDGSTITRIYDLYATGLESYSSIAEKLNAHGYRTYDWKTKTHGLFGRESVRTILRNRAYCGFVSSGGVEFHGKHPSIVTIKLWEHTEAIRCAREHTGGTFKVDPVEGEVLSGSVYCAVCGNKMHRYRTGRASSRVSRYVCSGAARRCAAPLPLYRANGRCTADRG